MSFKKPQMISQPRLSGEVEDFDLIEGIRLFDAKQYSFETPKTKVKDSKKSRLLEQRQISVYHEEINIIDKNNFTGAKNQKNLGPCSD